MDNYFLVLCSLKLITYVMQCSFFISRKLMYIQRRYIR